MLETKTCSKCGVEKPATAEYFWKSIRGYLGLASECKDCAHVRKNAYYLATREKRQAYQVRYRADNPAKCHALKIAWAKANPEKVKAAKQKHRASHYSMVCAQEAEYRAKHIEKISARRSAYRAKHLTEHAVYEHKRRAAKANAEGSYTAEDVISQHTRQKGKCFYCHTRLDKYHVDHVIPLALGGGNGPENIVIACPKCNLSKGAKHPAEFAGVML